MKEAYFVAMTLLIYSGSTRPVKFFVAENFDGIDIIVRVKPFFSNQKISIASALLGASIVRPPHGPVVPLFGYVYNLDVQKP